MSRGKKNHKKAALEFITVLLQQIVSIIRVVVGFSVVKLPRRTSDTCYVIGNGPSFSQSIVDRENELTDPAFDLFVVNGFAVTECYTKLRPAYYVMLDPILFTYKGEETDHPTVKAIFERIIRDTNWKLTMIVPHNTKNLDYTRIVASQNKNVDFKFYNYNIFEGFTKTKFWFFKRNLAMPQAENILVIAIFISINMGYQEIRVLGADHSWHEEFSIDNDNRVYINDKHFYQKGTVLPRASFSKQFLSLHKAFRGHEVVSEYARWRKARVVNMSKKSYIDAYERG